MDAVILTVRKGQRVYSTAPGWPREGRPARRTYKVEAKLSSDRVVWAGAGGYWRWIKDPIYDLRTHQ